MDERLDPSQGARAPRRLGKGGEGGRSLGQGQRLVGGKDLELLALSLDSFFFL